MKIVIAILIVIAPLMMLYGIVDWLTLQSAARSAPAIVVVPQMIQAVLIGCFGMLILTIGLISSVIIDKLEEIHATLRNPPRP